MSSIAFVNRLCGKLLGDESRCVWHSSANEMGMNSVIQADADNTYFYFAIILNIQALCTY